MTMYYFLFDERTNSTLAKKTQSTAKNMIRQFSMEDHISTKCPPTLLIHSADDQTVSYKNSESYFQSLIDKKIHGEIHLFPFGGHGYGLGRSERQNAPEWLPLALDFFERF